ncbi:MAG: hypothetical protein AB7E96_10810 [Deferribacterales bacterium]
MTDLFVSGWCGFSSLFGSFSGRFDFRVPFFDDMDGVFQMTGKNLVCWSTGANLALKNEHLDCDNIILVSPFISFTDYTPVKILNRMIKKFGSEPDAVIKDFLTACGAETDVSVSYDVTKLKSGLEYLLNSGDGVCLKGKNIKIIHGENDAVVPVNAGEELAERLSCELIRVKGGQHFISPDIIAEYLI